MFGKELAVNPSSHLIDGKIPSLGTEGVHNSSLERVGRQSPYAKLRQPSHFWALIESMH